MKREEEKKPLFLPPELYSRLEERAKDTGFGSVYEYVVFILEEVLKDEEKPFSKEEEEEVKKRLRALGYLE